MNETDAERLARELKKPLNRKKIFKILEEAYQIIRFRDEFNIERAFHKIEKAQKELGFSTEKMNKMTEEVTDDLF